MRTKLFALFSAVIFLSSCSYLNEDGSLKSAKSYSTIQADDFNFKLRNGLKYENTALNTYELSFKNDVELSLFYNSVNICTPEVYNRYCECEFSDRCSDIKTDVLNINGKEISYYKAITGKYIYSNYVYMTDHNIFFVYFRNNDEEKNKICDELAVEILESLEYTGKSISVSENEYIAVENNDMWFCESDTYSVHGNYMLAENVPQYKSNFTIKLITDGESDTAEKYADYEYARNIRNGYTYIQEVSEIDFFGDTAYVQSYNSSPDNINYVYFTEQNGLFYRICESVYEDNKDVKADMDNLIGNMTLKPVSAEMRDEINKVGFLDYTSPSFRYSISNCYHAPDKYASNSYFVNETGNYIRIKEEEYYCYDGEEDYTIQAGDNIITVTSNSYNCCQYVFCHGNIFNREEKCLVIETNITDVEKNERIMQFFESIKLR